MMQGLARFFASTEGASVIRRDRRKTLLKVSVGGNIRSDVQSDVNVDVDKEMFIKVFHFHGIVQRVRNSLGKSAGARELAANLRLATLGIAVPGAIGSSDERGTFGLLKNSLYAAHWISRMTNLRDLLIARLREGTLSSEWMDSLGRAAGEFTAGLHKKGVAPCDMNTGNLLVMEEGGAFSIKYVDYEGIGFHDGTPPRAIRIQNLAHLGASLVQIHQSACDAMCRSYAGALGLAREEMDGLASDVLKRSLVLAAAWKSDLDQRFEMIEQDMEQAPENIQESRGTGSG
ncbi:MAG: hypothetical protein KAR83_04650 [Thermodesulfovibrionales bacterium]|nr:hypothetical protein [Thermodesulfovibrionales bacterium]